MLAASVWVGLSPVENTHAGGASGDDGGGHVKKEADGSPVVTDNGNYLARCWFPGGIADPYALARTLADRPGIVDHGLFLDVATAIVAAGPAGVRVISR